MAAGEFYPAAITFINTVYLQAYPGFRMAVSGLEITLPGLLISLGEIGSIRRRQVLDNFIRFQIFLSNHKRLYKHTGSFRLK
jgi:hypothetical protein